MDSLLHPPPHPTPMQKHAGRLEAAERWEALGSQLRMTFIIYLSIHLSICLSSIYLSYLSIHLSISLFIYLSILSIHPSIYLIYLSVCLSVLLSNLSIMYLI